MESLAIRIPLDVDHASQGPVDPPTFSRWRPSIDSRPDKWMPELDSALRRQQTALLCRFKGGGRKTQGLCCSPDRVRIPVRIGRGDEQGHLCLGGQLSDLA
jgi:hypothetical protein